MSRYVRTVYMCVRDVSMCVWSGEIKTVKCVNKNRDDVSLHLIIIERTDITHLQIQHTAQYHTHTHLEGRKGPLGGTVRNCSRTRSSDVIDANRNLIYTVFTQRKIVCRPLFRCMYQLCGKEQGAGGGQDERIWPCEVGREYISQNARPQRERSGLARGRREGGGRAAGRAGREMLQLGCRCRVRKGG